MNAFEKFLMAVAPTWALSRARARATVSVIERHYDAASSSYRTENWARRYTDANAANGPALALLRAHGRDLHRNNGWAQNAIRVIGRNTVGWGLLPKAKTTSAAAASAIAKLWQEWAETTQCDADGRLTFYGMQRQVLETVALSGEALVRRRPRRLEDGLAIPLQLQVLEPDFLDTTKDGVIGVAGGPIVQGVEFDMLGRRVAYWLFEEHPGSAVRGIGVKQIQSKRVPASSVVHVFRGDRPGQARGISWLSAAVVGLKDFDEFEDASMVRHKVAAMFAAFVTDPDGTGSSFGEVDDSNPAVEQLSPGMIVPLAPGKEVSFASPPAIVEGGFTEWVLHKVAAAIGVTYEDLTGDYSKVNFSSARLARIAHWGNVHGWRWDMLVPQFCDPAWGWAMDMAFAAGAIAERPRATWTPPPMPMIEPDKEGLAHMRMVRSGAKTLFEMIREQGYDPDAFLAEYAAGNKKLDELGIVLDSDPRKLTQSGLTQSAVGGGAAKSSEKAEESEGPEEGDAAR